MSVRFSRRSFLRSSAAAAAALGTPLLSARAAAPDEEENSLFSPVAPLRLTQYGPVQGAEQGGHLVWYGIPYGAAPVGGSRWAAPQEPARWLLPRDCTSPAPMAYQYGVCPVGTEDCLTLDIYSAPEARKRPVLVYLHSSVLTGSAQELPGGTLAENADCVFVGLNYRLGLFGWNCLPALTDGTDATGNFALLDIPRALDWVRDNIRTFGGDPDNITLCGFADGGRLVTAALSSPLLQGRFQKAIALSGGVSRADPDTAAKEFAQAFEALAVEDGLFADLPSAETWLLTADPAVREWLCGLEPARVAALSAQMERFPCLFADGVTLPGDAQSITNTVPLLLMSSGTEFSATVMNERRPASEAACAFVVRHGSALCRWSSTEALAQSCTGNAPVWLGLVDYGGADSRTRIPALGSFHGILLALLAPESSYAACADFSSAGAKALSARAQALFRDFLRDGTPGWERWDAQSRNTFRLDADTESVFSSVGAFPDSADSILSAIDADTTLPAGEKQKLLQDFFAGWYFPFRQDA